MEADKPPFPNIDLFPRLTRIGAFLGSLTRHLSHEGISSHFNTETALMCPDFVEADNTGGGPAIDRYLYDGINQMCIDIEGKDI